MKLRTICTGIFFAILTVALSPSECYAGEVVNSSVNSGHDAYYREVAHLLDLTNAKEVAVAGCVTMWESLNLQIPNPQRIATKIFDDIWDDYVADCVEVYRQYFTLGEVKALNQFYSSPAGAKFARYQVQVSTECSEIIATKYTDRIQQIILQNL